MAVTRTGRLTVAVFLTALGLIGCDRDSKSPAPAAAPVSQSPPAKPAAATPVAGWARLVEVDAPATGTRPATKGYDRKVDLNDGVALWNPGRRSILMVMCAGPLSPEQRKQAVAALSRGGRAAMNDPHVYLEMWGLRDAGEPLAPLADEHHGRVRAALFDFGQPVKDEVFNPTADKLIPKSVGMPRAFNMAFVRFGDAPYMLAEAMPKQNQKSLDVDIEFSGHPGPGGRVIGMFRRAKFLNNREEGPTWRVRFDLPVEGAVINASGSAAAGGNP